MEHQADVHPQLRLIRPDAGPGCEKNGRSATWAVTTRSGRHQVPVAVLPTAKSLSAFSLKPQSDRLLGGHLVGAIGQAGGNPDRRTAARDVAGHDRTRADLGKVTDADVAENGRPRAEQDASADPWRAVQTFCFPPDRDVLLNGHLVADGHERADHDAGGMIQEHRRSYRRGGMDADLK